MRSILHTAAPLILVATARCAIPAEAAEPAQRTVTVSAMAEIDVVPDELVINFQVDTKDPKDLLKAKADNDRRTRRVLEVVRSYDVPQGQVRIDYVDMGRRYRRYDYQADGFGVTRNIEVSLKEFDIQDTLIQDALNEGATEVGGLLFRTRKNREHQFEARRLAVLYAREKAAHLAELNGLKLGKPVSIDEAVEANMHTIGMGMGGMGMGMGDFTGAANAPAEGPKVRLATMTTLPSEPPAGASKPKPAEKQDTIAPGVIVISSTVTITFELVE